jgi:anhydro-N-acetylmuramic acid kinase
MRKSPLIAGAMSGTSADGVDVAIVTIDGHAFTMSAKLLVHHHADFPAALKNRILRCREQGSISFADLGLMGRELSLAYAAAVAAALREARIAAADVSAIAAHGQTLFHQPPTTIQWLDPALLAAESGCAVVSDFRRADCAAGGQGAPLVGFADYILFRHPSRHRVLLNIGGIANLTWLPAGADIHQVIAFDTGPGNCISDALCRREFPGGEGFDPGGTLAQATPPIESVVQTLLKSTFFQSNPPRSTDGPAMLALFDSADGLKQASFQQRLSTAALLTVSAIEHAITTFLPARPAELIVSGGGTRNAAMMHHLHKAMIGLDCSVMTSDALGIASEAKEAIAFALLGAATLDGVPSNIPSVTGASRAVVLGSITPKP